MRLKLKANGSEVVVEDMLGAHASGNDVLVHTTQRGLTRLEGAVSCPLAVVSQNLTTMWVRLFGVKLYE